MGCAATRAVRLARVGDGALEQRGVDHRRRCERGAAVVRAGPRLQLPRERLLRVLAVQRERDAKLGARLEEGEVQRDAGAADGERGDLERHARLEGVNLARQLEQPAEPHRARLHQRGQLARRLARRQELRLDGREEGGEQRHGGRPGVGLRGRPQLGAELDRRDGAAARVERGDELEVLAEVLAEAQHEPRRAERRRPPAAARLQRLEQVVAPQRRVVGSEASSDMAGAGTQRRATGTRGRARQRDAGFGRAGSPGRVLFYGDPTTRPFLRGPQDGLFFCGDPRKRRGDPRRPFHPTSVASMVDSMPTGGAIPSV